MPHANSIRNRPLGLLFLFCALLGPLLFAYAYADGRGRELIVELMRDEIHLNLYYALLFLQVSTVTLVLMFWGMKFTFLNRPA